MKDKMLLLIANPHHQKRGGEVEILRWRQVERRITRALSGPACRKVCRCPEASVGAVRPLVGPPGLCLPSPRQMNVPELSAGLMS